MRLRLAGSTFDAVRATVHALIDPIAATVEPTVGAITASIQTAIDTIACAVEASGGDITSGRICAVARAIQPCIGDIAASIEAAIDAIALPVQARLDMVSARIESLGARGFIGKRLATGSYDAERREQNSFSHDPSPYRFLGVSQYNAAARCSFTSTHSFGRYVRGYADSRCGPKVALTWIPDL